MFPQFAASATHVLSRAERFWQEPSEPASPYDLLRYSAFLGMFSFAGYLFSYTITGKIWSAWPFIQTTLSVPRALPCAALQWIFFTTFPFLSSLLLERLLARLKNLPTPDASTMITAYSMTPLSLSVLFTGVPFLGRILVFLGMATFVYLLYYGHRIYLKQSILRSAAMTFTIAALFALIRQVFVYVIGF